MSDPRPRPRLHSARIALGVVSGFAGISAVYCAALRLTGLGEGFGVIFILGGLISFGGGLIEDIGTRRRARPRTASPSEAASFLRALRLHADDLTSAQVDLFAFAGRRLVISTVILLFGAGLAAVIAHSLIETLIAGVLALMTATLSLHCLRLARKGRC